VSSVDTVALAEQLACCVQQFEPAEQRTQVALFRGLAQGAPVSVEALAVATGQPEPDIRRYLARWHGVQTRDGAVVAFQGLSLAETPHRLRVDGCALYTWCAWDTLFIPELLGRAVEVESSCPTIGQRISLRVDDAGPRDVAPADTVLSFRPDSAVFVDGVQESFCRFVHFFSSPAAAEPWIAAHPGTVVISLEEGFEIGRRTNAAQFGSALRARSEVV
jgi:alkylmercury lyase